MRALLQTSVQDIRAHALIRTRIFGAAIPCGDLFDWVDVVTPTTPSCRIKIGREHKDRLRLLGYQAKTNETYYRFATLYWATAIR